MGEQMLNLFDEEEFVHDPNDKQLIVHYDEHAKYLIIILKLNKKQFYFLL